jgi:hypothetical protein
MSSRSQIPSSLWFPLVFIALALAFQWMKLTSEGMSLLPNFSPWMALAFAGTLVMPRVLPWWFCPAAMLGLNALALGPKEALGLQSLTIYAIYGIAAAFANRHRGRLSIAHSLLGVVACSLSFYLLTNTATWMAEPTYVKSLAGWIQAQTTGLPGYVPSWHFLRNAIVSDLIFSALLIVAFNAEARLRAQPTLPWLQRAAA